MAVDAQHNTTQHNTTQHNTTQHNTKHNRISQLVADRMSSNGALLLHCCCRATNLARKRGCSIVCSERSSLLVSCAALMHDCLWSHTHTHTHTHAHKRARARVCVCQLLETCKPHDIFQQLGPLKFFSAPQAIVFRQCVVTHTVDVKHMLS